MVSGGNRASGRRLERRKSLKGYHSLLLAAGAGSRFGGRKLLAPWLGEPLVRAAARAALAAPVDSCVVVTGCEAELVATALTGLGDRRLCILQAPKWSDGIAASLRAGLRELPSYSKGVVVFLGDMPRIPAESACRLIQALEAGALAAEYIHEGRPAHPVAFSSALFPELAALRGDTGARHLLKDRTQVARFETADPGAVFDVDRKNDLHR